MPSELAHNSNLTNAHSLRQELERGFHLLLARLTQRILMHLIRHSKQENFLEQTQGILETSSERLAYLV